MSCPESLVGFFYELGSEGRGAGRTEISLNMKKTSNEEVEYKQKSGTAWSHSYLNQKPWHPLSYPNQRRKWIAEQQNAQKERKAEEVAHEFAQQQEFFRQTSVMSKKEKEKVEALQAVGFMYMRPPGYNAESARAAEIADERRKLGLEAPPSSSQAAPADVIPQGEAGGAEAEVKKKPRVKDVFGRNVATEAEFAVLKDAPKLDTGVVGRVKPFAIEIRNVKCAKCGGFGHQSGDRECPLKDVITPNELERLKRNDPLQAIIAQATGDEPFKWELKNQPGAMSPARGGFKPDDPNQQILADEDIYDEYGGFLAGGGDGEDLDGEGKLAMPDILASLTKEQRKELAALRIDEKKRKEDRRKKKKKKRKIRKDSDSSESSDGSDKKEKQRRYKHRSHKPKKKKSMSDVHRSERGHRSKHRYSESSLTDSSSESDGVATVLEPANASSRKYSEDSDDSVDKRVTVSETHDKHHRRYSSSRSKEEKVHSKNRSHRRQKKAALHADLDEVHESFKRERDKDYKEHRHDLSKHRR